MDELPNSIHGKRYHLMSLKDPDYFMRMMTSYGKLENLEGSNTHQRYKGSRRELVTKWFNYCEVFFNQFFHPHQVDDSSNHCDSPIYVERTW